MVTLDTGSSERRGVRFSDVRAKAAYVEAVVQAGGLPLLVAPQSVDASDELLELADGLVVTGGDFDITPAMYGQSEGSARLDAPKPERTNFEAALLKGALDLDLPILAVCGGMQLLNVLLGGTLHQDIRHALPEALDHEQPTSPAEGYHAVQLAEDSVWAKAINRRVTMVNSTHHQAIDAPGNNVVVWGKSPDEVAEGFDVEGFTFVTGVQWHPELLADELSRALYGALVRSASPNAKPEA